MALAGHVHAQGLPPWVPEGHLPLPEDARSVEILRREEPIFAGANASAPRRGAAAQSARLPLLGRQSGAGCHTDFLLVGSVAWVCGDGVRISTELPVARGAEPPAAADGLPRDYYFVGKDGTLGYRDIAQADETAPAGELQAGFAVSVLRVERAPSGDPFGLTTKGLWLPLRDLTKVSPLGFEGYEVSKGLLDRGWVVADAAPITVTPAGKRLGGRALHRFDRVTVLETREDAQARTWVRIGDAEWLDGRDVRIPELSAPPPEARPRERWIDVDLGREVLVAYEGAEPVFATLVSTGLGQAPAPTATPVGVHRIWVKLRTTDMTNLEDREAAHYYAMEEVPWVLFFEKGFGLHGAFWHRSFGSPRSHGCVNLTPLDAHRLFEWASPRLPPGWTAVLPTDYDPGTLVRVR